MTVQLIDEEKLFNELKELDLPLHKESLFKLQEPSPDEWDERPRVCDGKKAWDISLQGTEIDENGKPVRSWSSARAYCKTCWKPFHLNLGHSPHEWEPDDPRILMEKPAQKPTIDEKPPSLLTARIRTKGLLEGDEINEALAEERQRLNVQLEKIDADIALAKARSNFQEVRRLTNMRSAMTAPQIR